MGGDAATTGRGWLRPALSFLAGSAVGLVCLAYAFRLAPYEEVAAGLARMEGGLLVLGACLYALDIAVRVLRWHWIIAVSGAVSGPGAGAGEAPVPRPSQGLSRARVAEALVAGYAMNNLLPARLGELVRADLLKRRAGGSGEGDIGRSRALATILVERLADGLSVVALLGAGLVLHAGLAGSGESATLAWIAGVAGTGLVAVLGVAIALGRSAVFRDHPPPHAPTQPPSVSLTGAGWGRGEVGGHTRARAGARGGEWSAHALLGKIPGTGAGAARWLGERTRRFAVALGAFRLHHLGPLAGFSVVIWVLEAAAIWAVCQGSGMDLGPVELMIAVGAISLSTLVPTAPGYIGSYQLVFALVAGAFGLPAAAGVLSATAVQLALLAPLTVVGIGIYGAVGMRGLRAPLSGTGS